MAVPVLWIGVSYFALLFMAAFGEGAIKFVHIMHVAFAFILLLAVALVKAPRPLGIAILTGLIVANVVTLQERYSDPYQGFSTAMAALESMTPPGEEVYY